MPGDVDYVNLGRMIVPLELNYCQCMLELEEYYEVIEHATELLDKHKGERPFQRTRSHEIHSRVLQPQCSGRRHDPGRSLSPS